MRMKSQWGVGLVLAFFLTVFGSGQTVFAGSDRELCFSITSNEVPGAPVLFITLGLKNLKKGHFLVSGASCEEKGSKKCGPVFGNAELVEGDDVEITLIGADLNDLDTPEVIDDLFASVQTHVILNFDTGNGAYSSHALITVGNQDETNVIFQDSGTVKSETCAEETREERERDKRFKEFLKRQTRSN
ncbi:MAG: hypothetical protein AB7P69_17205 [Candidatus Binatia bacterium]